MPRKRRVPKRRLSLPQGLAEISLTERAHWSAIGPFVGPDDDWSDWATWGTFYGQVRDELFAARPWLRDTSIADRLFVAWQGGQTPAQLEQLHRDLLDARPDPRLIVEARHAA